MIQSQLAHVPDVQAGNFFVDASGPLIKMPASTSPTFEELQVGAAWIRFVTDNSPIDAATLIIETVLQDGERQISGTEYKNRLAASRKRFFGHQHAVMIHENNKEFPELAYLLGLEEEIEIDFPGLVALDRNENRLCPRLNLSKSTCWLGWGWLDHHVGPNRRVAIAGPPISLVVG